MKGELLAGEYLNRPLGFFENDNTLVKEKPGKYHTSNKAKEDSLPRLSQICISDLYLSTSKSSMIIE